MILLNLRFYGLIKSNQKNPLIKIIKVFWYLDYHVHTYLQIFWLSNVEGRKFCFAVVFLKASLNENNPKNENDSKDENHLTNEDEDNNRFVTLHNVITYSSGICGFTLCGATSTNTAVFFFVCHRFCPRFFNEVACICTLAAFYHMAKQHSSEVSATVQRLCVSVLFQLSTAWLNSTVNSSKVSTTVHCTEVACIFALLAFYHMAQGSHKKTTKLWTLSIALMTPRSPTRGIAMTSQ